MVLRRPTSFLAHPELGPDYIRAFGRQEPIILRDYRQQLDGLGQGRYLVLIGTADAQAEAMMKQGLPIAIVDPRSIREGSDVSPAAGATALFNRAPHPSAAKVYLNWLLSREGQTFYAKASGTVSSRLDVPADHTFPWRVPVPGAIKSYDVAAMDSKDRLMPLLEEVFGR